MKTLMILLAAMIMTGCASTYGTVYTSNARVSVAVTDVIYTAPHAVGVYTTSRIYGGPVWYNPHPYFYIQNHINYNTRYWYNHNRRYIRERSTPYYNHPRNRQEQDEDRRRYRR